MSATRAYFDSARVARLYVCADPMQSKMYVLQEAVCSKHSDMPIRPQFATIPDGLYQRSHLPRYHSPMMFASLRLRARTFASLGLLTLVPIALQGQDSQHGRKYKPPPLISHIVVTVEKGFNSKPLVNAAVVFHSSKDGKDNGNLEVKTDPEGRATMDLIEVGSHVTVQVIANGFATQAQEFDATVEDKNILIKMLRPRAQVSDYVDNDGKPAQRQPGVQEHEPVSTAPTANPPASTSTPQAGSPK
jgi:hypothetical protein